jgi:hypothetical protein
MRRLGGTNQAKCLTSAGNISEKDKYEILRRDAEVRWHEQSNMLNIHRQNLAKRQRRDTFGGRRWFDGTKQAELLTSKGNQKKTKTIGQFKTKNAKPRHNI